MLMWALLVSGAYLLGTFPSARIVASASGVDIRTVGSGNPGASNVTRVLGWRKGVWVYALDAIKGAAAAGIGLAVGGRPAGYVLGAAAIIGHVFPVWNRFKGGKGVATGSGVLAVLFPVMFCVFVVVWFCVSRLTGKASLASIAVVALLPICLAVDRTAWWEVVAVAVLCALVMARHLSNIRRLAGRREHVLNS